MKVHVVKMDYFHEMVKSFRLLDYFLGIFVLNCILTTAYAPFLRLIRMFVPVIIVGTFNLSTLIYKSLYLVNVQFQVEPSVQYMDTVQSVYDLFLYYVDMWFVYKYGDDVWLEYVNRYCYMDRLLGMIYYTDIKRTSARLFWFILILWIISSSYDFLVWGYSFGPTAPLYFLATYVHTFIKLLTSAHLSLNIMHVESRLRTIGDNIRMVYLHSENQPLMSQELLSYAWFCTQPKTSSKSIIEFFKAKNNVKWFRCYYSLLLEQVKFINCMFGIRIILISLSLLIEMIRLINLTEKVIVGSQHTGLTFLPALGSLVKVVLCAVLLISLVWRSEQAYDQRTRLMRLIDNLLIYKKIDESIIDEIKNFQYLIQARPVSFSMADFVRIDNSFLVSIASAVVIYSYSIILLQSVN